MQRNILIILIVGILLGIAGSFILFEVNNKGGIQNVVSPGNKEASITGTININGVVPENATLTLYQKQANSKNGFSAFAQINNPQDLLNWTFSQAKTNVSYEIKSILAVSGKEITTSDPIFVTAPATDEKIEVHIPSETGSAAVISGTIGLNGYIPSGSTITLEGKRAGEANYTVFASGLSAKDNQYVSVTSATSGQEYDVRAVLYDGSGNNIGESSVLSIIPPAENETFSINSKATPPVTPSPTPVPTTVQAATAVPTAVPSGAIISGSINFNGAALPNSRIVIFQRPSGSTNFQVAVDNISPVNGATWQWNGATSGKWYDMIAILKQRQSNGTDQDISDSAIQTFAAPASNEVFTLNSGYSVPPPGGQVGVTCGTISGGTTWSSVLSFPASTNAQSYWIQVGTTNGGVELMNQTMNATTNQNQQVSTNLQNGVTYFARYAYALVPNQQAGSSQFSPFSSTSQLRCSQ